MSICKLCAAEIRFVPTKLGATMPIDAEPHPDGTVELVLDHDGTEVAIVTGNLSLFEQEKVRYMPHWQSCTGDVNSIRRKR